ncbi:MAG: hypothetical protein HW391_84 [Chloroflexi bacterium]|nr:hypothetical protein [Chloroflexota bacterium]
MNRPPNTLVVVDAGAATTSVGLVARPGKRWRLLGTLAAPAGAAEDEMLAILAARVRATDPAMADAIGLHPDALPDLPRLASRSAPPRSLAVLGASRRSVGLLETVSARTLWRVLGASTETHDPREMTELALRDDVGAILVAAGEPPGPDERAALDDLAGLVGAVARRRPEAQIVIGGSIRGRRAWTEGLGADPPGDPSRIVEAPPIGGRRDAAEILRSILTGLLPNPIDGRRAMTAAATSLADLLDRRVEILEIGHDGGARIMASPGVAGADPTALGVVTARAALIPHAHDDAIIDGILEWTSGRLDRHRLGDSLRDLRASPWSDPTGDGARLRIAAAHAALLRLAAVTTDVSAMPSPDLTIVAGGCFAAAPPRAVVLSIADTIRRTGATQIAGDHARLLGPIGTLPDAAERRLLLADLAADLLVPLGSVVSAAPGGRRSEAGIGWLTLAHGADVARHALTAGELEFLDLPPGVLATATLEFRAAARIGRRTRRADVDVTGGLAGLLVDLRGSPLGLPNRRDRRRAVLHAWARLAWPEDAH